jgi:hypothetical protein
MLSGRPLLGSQHDAALFVGREGELEQLHRAASAGLNSVVVGQRGVGATTLVHALVRRLHAGERLTAVVAPCGGTRSVQEVLARVVHSVAASTAAPAMVATDTATGCLQQLAQAAHHGHTDQLVLVVDDLPAGLGAQLLDELRDELWSVGAAWVVTVPDDRAGELLALPRGAFFEHHLELDELTPDDAVEMLVRRLPGHDVGELQRLVDAAGGGHPRRVLDVARSVISLGNGELGPEFTAHTAALRELGRPAHLLLTELVTLGAASASDPALQERMGWSRVRVQQVLTQLEAAGLARSSSSRLAGGQGRPRKVFHPVPPVDWFAQQSGVPA